MEQFTRYTLDWFIQKYGEQEGCSRYRQKNQLRSEKAKGNQNGRYISINLDEFKEDVLKGTPKSELCSKYRLSPGGSFTGKLKECFGDTNLYRIRGRVWYRNGILYSDLKETKNV